MSFHILSFSIIHGKLGKNTQSRHGHHLLLQSGGEVVDKAKSHMYCVASDWFDCLRPQPLRPMILLDAGAC